MPVQIITLPFDPKLNDFDNEALQKALVGKTVINMKPELFSQNGQTYWTVWLEYESQMSPQEQKQPDKSLWLANSYLRLQ